MNGLLRLAKPVDVKDGDILEAAIKNYKNERIKVALTTSPVPELENALPKDVFNLLKLPSASRKEADEKQLKDYFAANNPLTQAKEKELAAAKKLSLIHI